MFRVLRWLFVLLLIVVAIGFYRGWFSFSRTDDKDKANVNLSVDKDKMKTDAQKVKEKIKGLKGNAKAPDAK